MKTNLERILYALILAPLAPLAGFLCAWWGAYSFLPERTIPYAALSGLGMGLLVDVLWLRRWIEQARLWKTRFWAVVLLFYSAGLFGFFMGVPLPNALLSIPAGMVAAIKLSQASPAGGIDRMARRTAWLTTAILACICAASAVIALLSPSTASDLQGMLGLGFSVTPPMLLALIGIGGAALLTVNWVAAWASCRLTDRFLGQNQSEAILPRFQ
jgi:hypothetical protein